MSNMSYCRFQNTASDLADCEAALFELFAGRYGDDRADTSLSTDELHAARRLITTCLDIVALFENEAGLNFGERGFKRSILEKLDDANAEAKARSEEPDETPAGRGIAAARADSKVSE